MFDNKKLQRPGIPSKIFVLACLILTVLPIFWVFMFSFKNNIEIMSEPLALPEKLDFYNYEKCIEVIPFGTMIKNTFTILAVALPVLLVFNIVAAFAISRFKVISPKFREFMSSYFVAGLIVPSAVVIFPVYKMMVGLHLWDSVWAVIIPFVGGSAPLCISVLVDAFDTLPPSLEEAGVLDGCNVFQLLVHVLAPLTKSAISTVTILEFLGIWNDFLFSKVMLNGQNVRTISLVSLYFKSTFGQDYGMMAAGISIVLLPQLIAFLFMQKYIVAGVSAGAVKE